MCITQTDFSNFPFSPWPPAGKPEGKFSGQLGRKIKKEFNTINRWRNRKVGSGKNIAEETKKMERLPFKKGPES